MCTIQIGTNHLADKIQHMVDDAVSKGARLLVGGKRGVSANGKGQYYQVSQ
jgi:acyl-CoA reductase-like NAD-dependent aldehyde dehydrogenase